IALDPRNDSRKTVDSFCSAGNGRRPTEIGLASELLWTDAALEQSSNRSRELSAAALPVSASRHLVSTSVQFGQSAAEKTESDQWLLVAHLSVQITSRARSHARAVLPALIAQANLSAKTVPRQCRESVSANMVPRQDRGREVGDFSKPRRKPP